MRIAQTPILRSLERLAMYTTAVIVPDGRSRTSMSHPAPPHSVVQADNRVETTEPKAPALSSLMCASNTCARASDLLWLAITARACSRRGVVKAFLHSITVLRIILLKSASIAFQIFYYRVDLLGVDVLECVGIDCVRGLELIAVLAFDRQKLAGQTSQAPSSVDIVVLLESRSQASAPPRAMKY